MPSFGKNRRMLSVSRMVTVDLDPSIASPSPMTSACSPNAPLGLHLESKGSSASARPGRSRADPQATPRLRANAILPIEEVSPLLYGDRRLTSEIGRNSSWRPHGAAGELDLPNLLSGNT